MRVFLAAVLGFALGAALFAPVPRQSVLHDGTADARLLLTLTNQARASAGLPALKEDVVLDSVALWRSTDMATRDYFSHDIPYPPGGKFSNELDRRGYAYLVAGENIGFSGFPEDIVVGEIQKAFMGSPTHRDAILGDWNRIGVGVATDPDGTHYFAVLFAKVPAATSTPRPTAAPIPRLTPPPPAPATPSPTEGCR